MTPTDPLERPPVSAGRRLLDACLHGGRLFHRGSGRALVMLFKLLVLAYFIFCALFLTLRYALLPNIDRYKGTVEQVVTRVVGRPVFIGTIVADWHGLNPRLMLSEVVIHNRTGDVALRLPRVSATVSWLSVPTAGLRLTALEILRPDLEIERDAEGGLFVGGIYLDPQHEGKGSGLDWLLQQRQIVIRDGWVRWKDAKRNAPELVLSGMTVALENHWLQHHLAIRATPPAEIGAPLDIRARFSHSPFARQMSDPSGWTGTLYVDWQQADLARGKLWMDYPIEVQQGQGAVRAWVSFDNSAITDLTADLALTDLSARLAPDLEMLNLKRVSGRVGAGETVQGGAAKLFNFGRRGGHAVALRDFSFETADGLQLPPTTISERHTAANASQPAFTEVKIASAELGPLSAFATRLPLAADQRQLLEELAPQGRLSNFSATWQGDFPNIKTYQVQGDFDAMSLRARQAKGELAARPGFANLSGNLKLNEKAGELHLSSKGARLEFPGLFADPVFPFEELNLASTWAVMQDKRIQVQVSSANFLHEGARGSVSGKYLSGSGGRDHGTLELQAQLDEADIRRTARYLPSFTEPRLAHWLSTALQGGKLRDARLNLKGKLEDFPFRPHRAGDKSRGQFTVTGRLVDAKLDYAAGELDKRGKPLWPVIENINGRIAVDRTLLDIQAETAQTHKVALSKVRATIPDLMAADSMLNIDGTAQGPLQELLAFTLDSPIVEWIGHFTDETRGSGNARLGLKLEMPLHRLPETRVKGNLQFAGNEVTLFRALPPIARASGELRFNEKGFELANLRGAFLGGPVALSGGSQKDGSIAVRADGALSAEGLRRNFATPASTAMLQRVSGGSRYTVQVNVRNHHPEVIVESSLQGIALDLPSPMKKAPAEILPLRVEVVGLADEGGAARDEIRASLSNLVNLRYARRKPAGGEWEVLRGGIGVNVPAPQPESGVVMNVSLRSLDLDAWRATMSGLSGEGAASTTSANTANTNTNANAPRNGTAASAGLAPYIDADVLAARADELIVGKKRLENVVVGASHASGTWQANIESNQVSGYVSWQESRSGRGRGRVTARLASLIVPPSAAGDVSDLLEGRGEATQIPALDITADNFELFGKKFGRLELQANNASTPTGREWRINRLSVVNPDANMQATGKFASSGGQPQSSLNYNLDIVDAGKLLDRLGFANVLRGGRGRMTGEVSWKGLPYSLDIPSLSGQLEMDIAAGQFLKVDPGAAKLLGVLSLQSLPRRLSLDFRDVFSEGFAFDGATARATIAQGVMKTDSFKMRSVNALVLMDGTVDLARESQQMHVVVIPEINAGAASVAYGLVNPVLGLGSFLAQLFLRDPLMRAFTMEYEISGSWKDPSIRKLPRSTVAETPKPNN